MTTNLQTPLLATLHQDANSHPINISPNENSTSNSGLLAEDFSRLRFQLYRIWLALTVLLIQFVNYQAVTFFWSQLKSVYSTFLQEMESYEPTSVTISCIFLLFGCYETFFAMERREKVMAQTGLLKFQYGLGILVSSSIYLMYFQSFVFTYYSKLALFITFGLPAISVVNWLGALAVIKAFQDNHPLARQKKQNASQISENQTTSEDAFWAQNRFVESQLWEYDVQLESWRYFIFRWWLKFAVALEMTMVPNGIVFKLAKIWRGKEVKALLVFLLPFVTHFMGAYCSYYVEVVIRTREREKSQRAISLLKIWLVMSTIFAIVVPLLETRRDDSVQKYLEAVLKDLRNFVLIPLVSFIGASSVDKILEQRDSPLGVSNFTGVDIER